MTGVQTCALPIYDYEPENAPEVPRPNKVKFIEVTDAEKVTDADADSDPSSDK